MVLYDDCYALCLPWVPLGHVGPVGYWLPGGVHVVWGFDLFPPGVGAFL